MILSRRALLAPSRESAPLFARAAGGAGRALERDQPEDVLFFFAFLPQFVDRQARIPRATWSSSACSTPRLALPVKAGVGFAAGSLSERLLRRPGRAPLDESCVRCGAGRPRLRIAASDRL